MLRIAIFIFLCFCAPFVSAGSSQAVSDLINLPEKDLSRHVWYLYRDQVKDLDSLAAFAKLDSMYAAGGTNNRRYLAGVSMLFKGKYLYSRSSDNNRSVPLRYYTEALSYADNHSPLQAEIFLHMAAYYFYVDKNYPLAFEHFLKGHQIIESVGYETIPNADELLLQLGNAYYIFNEFDKAKTYLYKSLEVPEYETRNRIESYNTLGLCYRDIESYDSAGKYLSLGLRLATQTADSAWMGIINGNLGEIYYRLGNDEKALQSLYIDYYSGLRNSQLKSAAHAAMVIAQIYMKRGQFDDAERLLSRTREMCYQINDAGVFQSLYYSLSALHRNDGHTKKAFLYIDSFIYYNKMVSKEKDVAALEKARRKIDTETHLTNIKLLESEKQSQVLVRNGMLAIVALLGIITWQRIRRIRLKQLKDMQIIALKQKRDKEELDNAQLLLHHYTEKLKQKSKMLEQVTAELELLHPVAVENDQEDPMQEEKENIIRKLQTSTILTEEDWDEFRRLFTSVHTTFFMKLNERFPNLTQAEIRYLTLCRLGLSINEKAAMLGISPDSVRRTRQRLNKKIGLSEQEIFDQISGTKK